METKESGKQKETSTGEWVWLGFCLIVLVGLPNIETLRGLFHSSPSPPVGWRYPTKADIKGDWADEYFTKDIPIPYHFSADLNGDGLSDGAWILISTKSDNESGVFVFFNQKEGDPKVIQIPGYSGSYAQGKAITLKPAGSVSGMGEEVETKFNHPGISFIQYEAYSDAIFWDNASNTFKSFRLSD
jgi:hypothetical protein